MFSRDISKQEADKYFGLSDLKDSDKFGLTFDGKLVVAAVPESRDDDFWLVKAPTFPNFQAYNIALTSAGERRLFYFTPLEPKPNPKDLPRPSLSWEDFTRHLTTQQLLEEAEGELDIEDGFRRHADLCEKYAEGLKDLDAFARNLIVGLIRKSVEVLDQAKSDLANRQMKGFKGGNRGD